MYNTSASWKEQIYTNKQCIMNVYFDNVLINSDYILDFKKGGEIFDEEFSLEIATSQYIELKILKDQIATMPEVIRVEFGILLNNNSNTTEIIPIGIYNLESYTDNDDGTLTIKALDNMIKFEFNYDGSTLVNTNGSATLLQVAQDICSQAGVELGSTSFLNSDKQIAVYDNSVSAREYIKYIAESSGGFACIGRDGKLYFKDIYQDNVQISIDMFGTYKWSEEFKISKVHYEDGVRNFTFGDSTRNTLYINQNNMFIVNQAQVQNIYNKIKNLTINSFEGQTIIDPAIDVGDKIIIGGKPVVFQGEMTLAGSFIADIKCNIQTKQKEETTVITPSQVAINRRVQGQIDQVEGRITQLVEETSENTQNISLHEQTINGITNTVSSVQTKLNNMQIGGTNLCVGTKLMPTNTQTLKPYSMYFSYNNNINLAELEDNFRAVHITTNDSWKGITCKEFNRLKPKVNEEYIIQTMVKSFGYTGEIGFYAMIYDSNNSKKTGSYFYLEKPDGTHTNSYSIGTILSLSDNTNEKLWLKLKPTQLLIDLINAGGHVELSFQTHNLVKNSNDGYINFWKMKLEKGNMPTDWTPAPEDIESNLEDNYYTKTETESKIEQKADSITSTVSQNYSTKAETTQAKNEAINSANTATDNKLANYSTTTQMNSAITQKANEITSTVTTLENKVNNMQVGGRNYLKNSKTTTTLTKPASSYAQYNWDSYHPLATKTLSTSLTCTLSFRFIPTDENYRPCTSIVVGKNANGDIWSKRIYYSDLKVKKYSDYYFYYASFTIPATEGTYIQSFIKFILSSSDSANLGGQVSHLKLEDGNMPTDWTPAPEDIDSNLTTNYYTKTETETKINQKADEISSTVSSVSTKLNNLQIGGTNLLRGTNIVTSLGSSSAWSNGTWRNAGAGTGTRTSISVSDAPNTNIKVGWSTTCTSGQVLIAQDNVKTTSGEIYTLSCYAKGTGSILLQYGNGTVGYVFSNIQITDENNWKKYSYTFTSKGTANIYIGSDSAGNDVSFCGIKLEKGNIATDWSPAPEDIAANYYTKTETETKIDQKADNITSTVNKTISNIQTGTENLLLNTAIKENTNNWTLASGITRTTSKTTPNGNYCFYYNISGLTSNSWRCANPADVSVQPGEILTADVNVFIPSSNDIDGEVALEIQYFNSSRTRIGYLKKLIDTTVVDKWQKATVTLEAPTNAAYANARVWVLKNGKFYVGDLILSRGNTSASWAPSSNDYTAKTELGTLIEQNWEHIKVAWNQISQYLQLEGTNGSASLNIYNQSNNKLMTLNANGETYYNGSGNEIGKIGIIRQNNKDILAFSMPVDWNNISSSRSMAWGIFDPNNNFLPIFYLAGLYGANNSEYEGQLVVAGGLSAQDIELEQGIIKASIGGFQVLNNNDQVMLSVLKNGSGSSTYFNLLDLISTWYNTTVGCHYLDFHNNRLANLGNVPVSETNDPNLIKVINNIGGFDDSYIYASFKNGGDVFVYSNSSDRNLKKNIKETNISAIELIQKINHVQFDWKSNERHQSIGYIAQEMQEVEESFVHHSKYKDKEDWQINTLSVLATATKAIQEQQEIIEDLQSRIEKLEKKVNK